MTILNFDLCPEALARNRALVKNLVHEIRCHKLVLKLDRAMRQARMKELIIFREEYNKVRIRNRRKWR